MARTQQIVFTLVTPEDGPTLDDIRRAASHVGMTLDRYLSLCINDYTEKLLQTIETPSEDGKEAGTAAPDSEATHGDDQG